MNNGRLASGHEPGRAGRIEAKASAFLLKRYDQEDWGEADQAALEDWLEESLSHRTAYWRLKAAWIRADRLNALQPMIPPVKEPAAGTLSTRGIQLAAAAAITCLIGSVAWYSNQPAVQTFSTAVGERSNLKLPDGSHVDLTTDTVLRVAKGEGQRSVWLDKGEAFFQVVHDDKHEFVLHALNFKVTDLGTEFSVRRDINRLDVTVVKGSVRIDPPQGSSRPVRLTAGQTAVADSNAIVVSRKSQAAIADALGWRNGVLVFRRTPLSEVVAEFNRWNTEKIVVGDDSTAHMTVSARLSATDVDMLARMARNVLGLQVVRDAGGFRISRGAVPEQAR
jgi:transmembrane sensor